MCGVAYPKMGSKWSFGGSPTNFTPHPVGEWARTQKMFSGFPFVNVPHDLHTQPISMLLKKTVPS